MLFTAIGVIGCSNHEQNDDTNQQIEDTNTTASDDINAPESVEAASDLDSRIEEKCIGIMICREDEVECYYFLPDTNEDFINSFSRLDWIAERGGAGTQSEYITPDQNALSIIEKSSGITENELIYEQTYLKLTGINTETWIRLIYEPYMPESGIGSFPHKDIVFATMTDKEDAFLARQDPENPDIWEYMSLPGYGQWLQREIDMFVRLRLAF